MENGISYKDIKNLCRAKIRKKWQVNYQESKLDKGRCYGSIQEPVHIKPWFDNFTDNRLFYSTMSRWLRYNHSYSPYYLNKIGFNINPNCHCLGEVSREDTNHIIMECNKWDRGRTILWKEIIKLKIPPPTNLKLLLTDIRTYRALFTFIRTNKLNI